MAMKFVYTIRVNGFQPLLFKTYLLLQPPELASYCKFIFTNENILSGERNEEFESL